MSKLIPIGDLIKTVSLQISGATAANFQGKRLRVTIPINNLVFDHHSPPQEAYFYALFNTQFGNSTTPAPDGIRLVSQETIMYGSDNGYPRHSVVSRLVLTFDFDSDAATFSSIPLIIKGLFKATDAPTSFSFPAFTADTSPALTVALADGSNTSVGVAVLGVGSNSSLTTINGEETITDLDVGSATEIHVDHSGDATFAFCEYPYITVPSGVRVTVLASSSDAHKTDGSNFVLLVENVSYATDGGYGDSSPDVSLSWARTGQVS